MPNMNFGSVAANVATGGLYGVGTGIASGDPGEAVASYGTFGGVAQPTIGTDATLAVSSVAAGGAGTGAGAGTGGGMSWLSWLGPALSLLGIGGQTHAAVQSADAHAAIARMEAQSIRESAMVAEEQSRRRARIAIGKGIATGAGAGLDVSSGSPLLTELDNTQQAELEALNLRRTGAVQAMGKEYEASLAKGSKSGAIFGGVAAAGGTLLSSWVNRRAGSA